MFARAGGARGPIAPVVAQPGGAEGADAIHDLIAHHGALSSPSRMARHSHSRTGRVGRAQGTRSHRTKAARRSEYTLVATWSDILFIGRAPRHRPDPEVAGGDRGYPEAARWSRACQAAVRSVRRHWRRISGDRGSRLPCGHSWQCGYWGCVNGCGGQGRVRPARSACSASGRSGPGRAPGRRVHGSGVGRGPARGRRPAAGAWSAHWRRGV